MVGQFIYIPPKNTKIQNKNTEKCFVGTLKKIDGDRVAFSAESRESSELEAMHTHTDTGAISTHEHSSFSFFFFFFFFFFFWVAAATNSIRPLEYLFI
jgi:hypothetical protein